ncbi:MAG: ErfK/YbiS/YcfS/YnhG family protein [Verrucomicrobiaceae bacterium]|nr:ErfK/YbiS/YcfS/YnhG family protein [Verrucomicrobiaceae bacterium]
MRSFFASLPLLRPVASLALLAGLCQCSSSTSVRDADVVVSVKDQKLGYYLNGKLKESYKISTSKFGIGDKPGSCCTPLGKHEVVAKIGHGLPTGAVLKSRQWNGEVLKPNAPGRDPVVSRIMWLSGLEANNHNALGRFIYIHGTTEEDRLGKPASYGCVRMSMSDVVHLFNEVNVGAKVVITKEGLPSSEPMMVASSQTTPTAIPAPASSPPILIPSAMPSNSMPVPVPSGGPGEIHSEYQPAHPPARTPINGEPTMNGRQRLLIPVGHSVSKSSKKEKAKNDQKVTLKGHKKSEPTPTSAKKRKKDKTLAAA